MSIASYKHLRLLKENDAPLMLEWMHDKDIASVFAKNFLNMTVDDVHRFIQEAQDVSVSCHFAIVDDNDEYMGTVSLKNIDTQNLHAEYAISTRKCTHGTGLTFLATQEILDYAFNELGLHKVYLNVLSSNKRAAAFYKKCGFFEEGCFKDWLKRDNTYHDLLWFGIINPKHETH